MHCLELAKFNESAFDKENALARWMYFFKVGYSMPDATLTREVLSMDTGLQQFAEKYNISMQDPHLQLRYTQFHLAEMDYNTDIHDAMEKGRMKAVLESLQYMQKMGMPSPALREYAKENGIDEDQLRSIIQNSLN